MLITWHKAVFGGRQSLGHSTHGASRNLPDRPLEQLRSGSFQTPGKFCPASWLATTLVLLHMILPYLLSSSPLWLSNLVGPLAPMI